MHPMRKYFVLCGLSLSLFLILSAQGQQPKIDGRTQKIEVSERVSNPVGISGCSGGGCHGQAIPTGTPAFAPAAKEAWKCAYTHWLSYDNHAKAFNVLREERALKMMVKLCGQEMTNVNADGQVTDNPKGIVGQKLTIPVRVSYDKDGETKFTVRRATFDKEPWQVVPDEGDSKERKFTIIRADKYHPDATQESRCLACHVNPTLAFTPSDPDARKNVESHRRQGVGCEACHGNASSWRDSHVNWADGPGKRDLYKNSGMVWLNDPISRARACAGCHIGAPPDKKYYPDKLYSPEVRNMNHDMIAAGHPRLNFEYNTYQALETPHWIEKNRNESDPAKKKVVLDQTFHGRNWLIGRAVQMEKSIALLEYRTRKEGKEFDKLTSLSEEAEAIKGGKQVNPLDPWPELAEFNCYGCHSGLRAEFYLPKKSTFPIPEKKPDGVAEKIFKGLADPGSRPVGNWVWDPLFGTARVFNQGSIEEKAINSFIELQKVVQLKKPVSEIHDAAVTALERWEAVTESLKNVENFERDKREAALFDLPKPARWDDLAQTYLGLRGLNNNQSNPEIEAKLLFPYRDQEHRQDGPQSYDPRKTDDVPKPYDPASARSEFKKDIGNKK